MKRPVVAPEITQDERGVKSITHPAFGNIRVSRASGNASLYGSDFNHNHYMTIQISRSRLKRELSTDWEFSGEELIEVSLSEAQWASFVSSPNVGAGVACTISHVCGEYMPYLPPPEQSNQRFKDEILEQMAALQEELIAMASSLDGAINKTKATELKTRLERLSSRLTGNLSFVSKQFDEHIERTVEKAKIEINAHAVNLVMQTGITALKNGAPAISYNPDSK